MATPVISIITPVSKIRYPIIDPRCKLQSAYIHFCFGVNSGGDATVSWGFDKKRLGAAKIYHDILMEFSYKFPRGKFTFWVEVKKSGVVRKKKVTFAVG